MRGSIPFCKIGEYLPVLEYLNDSVRFVDPQKKLVVNLQEMGFVETNEHCFEHWCQKSSCDNCVSTNAHHKNSSFVKIVDCSDSIIMVTAIPIDGLDKPIAIELFNDITTSLIYGNASGINVQQNLDAFWGLKDMALKDQLTSLYNRRFLDDRLAIDLQNANTKNYPISILFIDIDDFKNINDNFGHDVGDIALQEAANVLKNVVRAEIDWAARYGGDEFLICLNHADENTARMIAERVCANIEKVTVPVKEENIHFTVSIGVHTMHQKELSSAEIIKAADQNMYKSKSEGKNRITISSN